VGHTRSGEGPSSKVTLTASIATSAAMTIVAVAVVPIVSGARPGLLQP